MKIKYLLLVAGSIVCAARLASAADASDNWTKLCASCHAKDGTGSTVMGKKYGTKDYTDPKVQADLTDDKAIQTIKEGFTDTDGKTKMKPFKDKLTDGEITALVAYIRSFKK